MPITTKDIEKNKYSFTELEKFQKSMINGWLTYWVNTSKTQIIGKKYEIDIIDNYYTKYWFDFRIFSGE